ncbi:MAG: hypothetical protein L0387_43190 [Acidobacteria bacterium]|nr:hypothetical protein [Acidobacteriota bacterium]
MIRDVEHLTGKVVEDVRALAPQFLMPLREIKSLNWLQDKGTLLIAAIGLLPLVALVIYAPAIERLENIFRAGLRPAREDIAGFHQAMKYCYWVIALDCSALWAFFLYNRFPSPGVTPKRALACFFGTGLVSISLLLATE